MLRISLACNGAWTHGTNAEHLRRLRLLVEAMQTKAKGEPTIPLAEVKRRIAAKKAAADDLGR